jgi:hypothetical protein
LNMVRQPHKNTELLQILTQQIPMEQIKINFNIVPLK